MKPWAISFVIMMALPVLGTPFTATFLAVYRRSRIDLGCAIIMAVYWFAFIQFSKQLPDLIFPVIILFVLGGALLSRNSKTWVKWYGYLTAGLTSAVIASLLIPSFF